MFETRIEQCVGRSNNSAVRIIILHGGNRLGDLEGEKRVHRRTDRKRFPVVFATSIFRALTAENPDRCIDV